jgi:predicted RNA-binding protein Jag
MYDAGNEAHEFVGADRDEAIAKACQFFRLDVDALAIHELDAREVYGLGSRTVIVCVPLNRKAPAREARARSAGDVDEGREARRGRDGGGRDRGGRGEGREGRRDRGGERGEHGGARRERDRGGLPAEGRDERRDGRREGQAEVRRETSAPQEPSVGTVSGELGEIGRFVLGTVERMGLGPFEISETGEPGLVVLSLRGPGALALGRGDGRPVDALQLIANQVAMRLEEDPDRVVLDVEGDLEEREGRLGALAERAARRARETGRAIALDPMSPRDRRVIHLALRDVQGIATMSVGEGRYRQVVVVPEGAPEYEEALREARAAVHRSDDGD